MKKWAFLAAIAVLALGAVLGANGLSLSSRQIDVLRNDEQAPPLEQAAARLAQAVRFRTVSSPDGPGSAAEFRSLHAFLASSFPRVYAALDIRPVNGLSLLYEWRGTVASLPPVLLMAHQDVVPAEPASAALWSQPPFGGALAQGFIWGRGTLDDKGALMALHEAAETLLAQGFQPARTVYFAFGHDEEIGGGEGAAHIARLLLARGVRLQSVLDEGQVVTQGLVPGFVRPVALIGIAEKGYLSVELVVEAEGGHASMPPAQTAAGIVSAAVARLEDHPFPATLSGPLRSQFAFLGAEQGWLKRMMFANLWLFAPLIEAQLSSAASTNALLRTTLAPTMLEGSVKDNVLPTRARAVVNLRLLPGMSSEQALRRVARIVDDARVEIAAIGASRSEPSPVSSIEAEAFDRLHRAIKATFPEAIVSPSLVPGATDSRYFVPLAQSVLRFVPARVGRDDLKRYHGVDERVGMQNYGEFIRFYMRYLREAAGQPS